MVVEVLFSLVEVFLDELEDGLVEDSVGEDAASFRPKPNRRASQEEGEEELLLLVLEEGDDDTVVVVVVVVVFGVIEEGAAAAVGGDRVVANSERSSSLQNKEGGFLGLSSINISRVLDFTKKLAKGSVLGFDQRRRDGSC